MSERKKKSRAGWIISLLLLLVIVASYMWEFPSGALRYRMTVQVEADGQLYEASAVHQVRYGLHPPIVPGFSLSRNFDGEAIALDIADRGTLFVLLTGVRCCADEPFSMDHGYNGVESFASVIFDLPAMKPEVIRSLASFEQRVDVPFNRLPMMVRFRDLGDPLSIELVNPYDLAASFGEGVRLRGIRLETTRERVWFWTTNGILDRLPWLRDLDGGYLDGARISSSRELTNSLSLYNFRQ